MQRGSLCSAAGAVTATIGDTTQIYATRGIAPSAAEASHTIYTREQLLFAGAPCRLSLSHGVLPAKTGSNAFPAYLRLQICLESELSPRWTLHLTPPYVLPPEMLSAIPRLRGGNRPMLTKPRRNGFQQPSGN
jgi:hypothetical protein